jgi:hypothetical protein
MSWQGLFGIALIVLALFTVGLGFTSRQEDREHDRRTRELVECIGGWADMTSTRTERLTTANRERLQALDAIVRALPDGNREEVLDTIERYIVASDASRRADSENPAPVAPQFVCGDD